MVSVPSLWLPILLAAVCVFVVSSIIHMVLPYHRTDMRKVPAEDELLDALRKLNIPPGDYGAPNAGSPEAMRQPEFVAKMTRGPVVFMTVLPGGPSWMASSLTMWFLYSIVVGVFAAYVAGRALGPGADYLAVFRFAGVTAFAGYALALPQHSIWYKRSWATTLKSMADGFLYALFTAGCFGWLWPR
jgi:hypothetical protein